MERIKTINLRTMQKQKDFWDNYLFVAIVIGIILVMVCFFRRTVVTGASMESTFFDGQNLIVSRSEYNNNVTYDNGDVVVIDSSDFGTMIIKRVIGTPGDTIEIKDNVVYLNDVALEEDYINEPMDTKDLEKITLAEDEYFVMGDNRNRSSDSRRIGAVKADELFGKIVFDIRNMSTIKVPEVFNQFRN